MVESLSERIEKLERSLLEPHIRQSKERLNRLLADDFYEIGASGRTYDKQAIMTALSLEKNYGKISDFKSFKIADNLILVSYHLEEESRMTKRSSIWRENNDEYQMIFHQGTIVIYP